MAKQEQDSNGKAVTVVYGGTDYANGELVHVHEVQLSGKNQQRVVAATQEESRTLAQSMADELKSK